MQLSFLILAMIRWERSDRLALMVRDRMPFSDGGAVELLLEDLDGRSEE